MTTSFSLTDFWELAEEITPSQEFSHSIDPAESFWAMPDLHRGYARYLDLGAGIEFSLWQEAYFDDTEIFCPTRSHPWVEFSFLLKGSYRLETASGTSAVFSTATARVPVPVSDRARVLVSPQ